MICPVCKEADQKSKLYSNGMSITSMGWTPYYDEEGRRHSHDPNQCRESFTCSNGHKFERAFYQSCPTCRETDGEESIRILT